MKKLIYIFITSLIITNAQAQCGSIVCNPNTGGFSDTNAADIAYDNVGIGFHSTFIHEAGGIWRVWGEQMMNDGNTDALTATVFNQANYPALGTSTIYMMAMGSKGGADVELIVLTTTGLHVLGRRGIVLSSGLVPTQVFQAFAVNGKADGLPAGVGPADVKMMFATQKRLTITTCSGLVYTLGIDAISRGNNSTGNAGIWSQVMQSAGVPLTNVIVSRGNFNNNFALKSDGTLWTWGENTLLGNGSGISNRGYATQMTLPPGIPGIKMIQMGCEGDVNASSTNVKYSYYVLGTDKKVYALGYNGQGDLGDNSTTDRLSWVNSLNPDNSIINNAVWISANEHDQNHAGFAVIKDTGLLYTCGANNGFMVARTIGQGINYLDIPGGITATDVMTFIEVGGHSTLYIKQGALNYGYSGHRTNGSMASGAGSGNENTVNFAIAAAASVCGTVCVAPTITTNSPVCSGTNAVFTINGRNGDNFTYTLNGIAQPVATIVSGGVVNITIPSASVTQNLSISSMTNNTFGTCTLAFSGASAVTSTITVITNNTIGAASSNPSTCVGSAITPITFTTSGPTGVANSGDSTGVNGLPPGVSASWSGNTVTISGTPTSVGIGTYNYSIPTTGGCAPVVNAVGTITVTGAVTVSAPSSSPTLCINTALSPTITHTTTNATGISNDGVSTGVNGLPPGVSATWSANVITISGTPNTAGTYNYSIPITGCSSINASGTIIVSPNNTVTAPSSNPTLCINTILGTNITHTTTGATGIGTPASLPTGMIASWSGNTITISGTPSVAGTFNYSIPLTGGCGTINATGTITVTPDNTVTAASSSPSPCILTLMTNITHTTTGATGIANAGVSGANGLPNGVSALWAGNTITISGTPSVAGTFNYSILLTGGCGTVNATGTITVVTSNGFTAGTSTSVCIGTAISPVITQATTGATGIANSGVSGGNGLPLGVSATWAGNTITISGTPSVAGTYNYSIPLTGGCGTISATGIIIVSPNNTVTAASSSPSLCIFTLLGTNITHTTTGATGIGTPASLPTGMIASWSGNTITISGTPSVAGTFNYSIPLTGGCGLINATGTINVTAVNTVTTASSSPSPCIFTLMTNITHTTTGASGIANAGFLGANGLPNGVSATWSANTITISGTPSVAGTYNYSIPLTGGCGSFFAAGTIVVTPNNTITLTSGSSNQTLCQFSAIATITYTTTGATGILNSGVSGANGLPAGVTASFTAPNTVTISGTPTPMGTFNYTITLTGGCGNITTTGQIRTIVAPTINPSISDYIICDDDDSNDGMAFFNLPSKIVDIIGAQVLNVTFHETLTDAQNNANPTLLNYFNSPSPYNQQIYCRVVDPALTSSCYTTGSFWLRVKPRPVPPLIITDYKLCDNNTVPGAGIEQFNLHTKDTECGAGGNVVAYYYANQPDAQAGLVGTRLPYLYTNLTSPYLQTIWVRLEDNTIYTPLTSSLKCSGSVRSFDLIVNPLPTVAIPLPAYTLCETTPTPVGYELFDLTSKIPSIVGSQVDMNVSFHFLQTDAQNDTNPLASPYQNGIASVQTIWVRVENSLTGCFVLSTMDLRVNQLPVPIPLTTTQLSLCDQDQDGLTCSDLTLFNNQISSQNVTWYNTESDAKGGLLVNQLIQPHCTLTPFLETVWIRVEDVATGCFIVRSVTFTITPAPLSPLVGTLSNLIECDDKDSNNLDGIATFDFTPNRIALTNLQTGSGYTITYHTTLADASGTNAVAPISNPTNYRNNTSPNLQTIWIRISHASSGCYNYGSFDLIVNKPQPLNAIAPFTMCDDDSILLPFPSRPFNLMSKKAAILAGAPLPLSAYAIEFYPSYSNPQSGTPISATNALAYNNTSNAQTLGVVVTTPDGCKSYTTLTIRVIPIPKPRQLVLPTMTIISCDNINSPNGTEIINVQQNEAYIRNLDSSLTFEYYTGYNPVTQIFTGLIPTPNTTVEIGTGTVYIKIMNNQVGSDGNRCYTVINQPVIINPLPTISNVNPNGHPTLINTFQKCRPTTSTLPVGVQIFNLTTMTTNILLANPAGNYTVTYSTSVGGPALTTAQASAFQNGITPQIIYTTVTNTTTGCINRGQFNVQVDEEPVVGYQIPDLLTCDTDGTNDGNFDYTQNPLNIGVTGLGGWIDRILGGTQTTANFDVLFFEASATQTALQLATIGNPLAAIQTPLTHQVKTGNYQVRIENKLTHCYILDSFDVNVEQLAEPVIVSTTASNTICVDFITGTLINGITIKCDFNPLTPAAIQNATDYKYEWYWQATATGAVNLEATITGNNTFPAIKKGFYTVKATSLNPTSAITGGCPSIISAQFEVKESSPASIGNPPYFVTNAFQDTQTITVNFLGGNGNYQYSIDGGVTWQSSTVFTNVPIGVNNTAHEIWIDDLSNGSCSTPLIPNVRTIDFPHYFTPNGDGIHDIWNVTGLSNQPNAKIYIFDRFGKLLKQISTTSDGWDGTINGNQLVSDDYWFSIEFNEKDGSKVFKSNFSLKR